MITPYFLISLTLLIAVAAFGCAFSKRVIPILLLVALFIPVSYGAVSSLMGKPKPVRLEWAKPRVEEALVVGSVIREGVGIFVYILLPGEVEPMSYVLPWNEQAAEQLQKAEAKSAQSGKKGAMVKLPFEMSLDPSVPRFYDLPQPQMPEKQPPVEDKPMVLERST